MQNGIYRVAYIHSVIVLKCPCTEHWECSESLLLLWAFSDLRKVLSGLQCVLAQILAVTRVYAFTMSWRLCKDDRQVCSGTGDCETSGHRGWCSCFSGGQLLENVTTLDEKSWLFLGAGNLRWTDVMERLNTTMNQVRVVCVAVCRLLTFSLWLSKIVIIYVVPACGGTHLCSIISDQPRLTRVSKHENSLLKIVARFYSREPKAVKLGLLTGEVLQYQLRQNYALCL